MLKKTILLSSLVLFLISNTMYSNGDECAECMNQAAIGTCVCITSFCILAVGDNKKIPLCNTDNFVSVPKIQQMVDNNKKNK